MKCRAVSSHNNIPTVPHDDDDAAFLCSPLSFVIPCVGAECRMALVGGRIRGFCLANGRFQSLASPLTGAFRVLDYLINCFQRSWCRSSWLSRLCCQTIRFGDFSTAQGCFRCKVVDRWRSKSDDSLVPLVIDSMSFGRAGPLKKSSVPGCCTTQMLHSTGLWLVEQMA